jgi:transposase
MLLADLLLPDESQLCIDRVEIEGEDVLLSVSSTREASLCPLCNRLSDRVHSQYQRHPADLPIVGHAVRLDMNVRKFFCDNSDCKRVIFTERLPSVLAPYARRTNRLASRQQKVAFALGGEAGANLSTIIDMTASPDTLLRLIHNAPEPEVKTPRVLGVDEWAQRKGQSYGTILVDLEAHQPVDLLPDRSAESFAKWLREHPGVKTISRDRGKEYIKGVTEGAPDATQVADRWHLLKNLRDSLERWLTNRNACLRAAADNETQQEEPASNHIEQKPTEPTEEAQDTSLKLTKAEKQKLERREKRQERFESVKELHGRGLSKSEISRRLNLDWRTIDKYIKADECPVYAGRYKRPSKLDPYIDYMTQRWQEGCHNATQIWREIRERGFDGARRTVAEWATRKRKSSQSSQSDAIPERLVRWSPRRASWLLVKQEDELTQEDRQALERMKQADEKLVDVYILGQRFTKMVRERQPESLLPWLEDATKSGIDALKQFAKGIKQDLAAVTNALSLPWSNGQTEGQVNRLKLIKRQMYGRASFSLLRKRVLVNLMIC